jgi:exonuclease SbcC
MKILAIRGKNLASLAGDFEVALDRPPLDGAGLFAIVGPTGSGKSTILDALCLALYGRTPRLNNHGGTEIRPDDDPETEAVKSNDARALLRHGTPDGFAEVDFLGIDGHPYRARWSVRRARESAQGRLQNEDRSLIRIDTGQPIASGKVREVGEEIDRLIGLDYEQFTRSVLLAQGEFARFLRADEQERATLLETLTGTELYTQISVLAFRRAKEEDEALKALRTQRETLAILTPEERSDLETERSRLDEEKKGHEAQRKAIDAALAWYAELRTLREDEEKAAGALAASEAAVAETVDQRAELTDVRSVQDLRPVLQNHDQRAKDLQTIVGSLEGEKARLSTIESSLTDASAAMQEAEKAQHTADTALTEMSPQLDAARKLDTRIEGADREVALATKAAGAASARMESTRKAAEQANERVRLLEERITKGNDWFQSQAHLTLLAKGWENRHRQLTEYAEKATEQSKAEEEAALAAESIEASESALADARKLRDEAHKGLEQAREALTTAEANAAEITGESIQSGQKTWTKIRDWATALQRIAEDADAATRAAADHRKEAEDASLAQSAAREAHAQCEAKLVESRAERAAQETAVRLAEAARGFEEHRAGLADGEPCPLCGSTEHPWAGGPDIPPGDATRLRKRLDKLATTVEDLVAEVTRHAADIKEGAATARKATTRADKEGARLEQLIAAWKTQRGKLRQPAEIVQAVPRGPINTATPGAGIAGTTMIARSGIDQPGTQAAGSETTRALAAILATADERLDEFAQADQERTGRLQGKDAAQKAVNSHQEAFAEADRTVTARDRKVLEDRNAVEVARKEQRRLQNESKRLLASLDPVLKAVPGWKDALRAAPTAFLDARTAEIDVWIGTQKDVEQTNATLQKALPLQAAAETDARNATEVATATLTALTEETRSLESLRAERAGIFGGRAVADVLAEAETARAEAARALESLRTKVEELRNDLAGARRGTETLASQRAGEERGLDSVKRQLEVRLTEHKIDQDRLRALLGHDAAWIETTAKQLDTLDKALQQAGTVLAERRRKREEKESSSAPAWTEQEAADQSPTLTKQLEETDRLLGATRVRLGKDDDARGLAQELAKGLVTQEERARLWRSLSDLIGSSDGKKLRVFAQGLTLDILLAETNEFLRELAPRYLIRRVPRSNMDLMVVDQDMGDEVRTVNSLSGGEGFLVSLALALGLSSLSSRRTHVGSLFIDEGFGTLDPRSLELALSVLDSLQATGRQIAVISHVQGMAESIGHRVRVRPRGTGRSVVEVAVGD